MSSHDGLTFSPHLDYSGARARGCFTCEFFEGRFYADRVVCDRNKPFRYIPGEPSQGCAFWLRAISSDD